jgi:4-amino-4-deoxy-L-arabinose transferase-like glycosyltransferase
MISLEKKIENNKWLVLASIIIVFTALRIVDSYFRPFWFDELFTWHIAQIPTFTGLWKSLGPMDPSPPLYYVITRIFQSVLGHGEFATRLPALISFLVAMFFLFLILDRRCGAITAITGVLLLCLTPATLMINIARTYTFVLALCTISLWCWQVAASGDRRILPLCGLFLSLCMALYSHFYAFLLFVPVVAGEIYRSFKIKQIDWPVWLTLLLAALTVIPLLPLAARCTSLSKSFWSKPDLFNFLQSTFLYAAQVFLALIAFVISIFVKYVKTNDNPSRSANPENKVNHLPPGHEVVAAVALALIPVLVLPIAVFVTNAFTYRYFVSAVIGAIIVLAYFRLLIKRSWVSEGFLLMIIAAVLCIVSQAYLIFSMSETDAKLMSRINIMSSTGDELPIVMLSPISFLATQHYAPEALKKRIFYLVDYDLQFQYEGNSADISLAGLSKLAPIMVASLETFLKTHKTFYIAGGNRSYALTLKTKVVPGYRTAIPIEGKGPVKYLYKVTVN